MRSAKCMFVALSILVMEKKLAPAPLISSYLPLTEELITVCLIQMHGQCTIRSTL